MQLPKFSKAASRFQGLRNQAHDLAFKQVMESIENVRRLGKTDLTVTRLSPRTADQVAWALMEDGYDATLIETHGSRKPYLVVAWE